MVKKVVIAVVVLVVVVVIIAKAIANPSEDPKPQRNISSQRISSLITGNRIASPGLFAPICNLGPINLDIKQHTPQEIPEDINRNFASEAYIAQREFNPPGLPEECDSIYPSPNIM